MGIPSAARMGKQKGRVGGLSATAVIGGRVSFHGGLPAVMPLVALDLSGLVVQFGGHQAQTLGAREIEATPRDAEAVFGLAAQELRGQHQAYFLCFLRW